MLRIYMATQLSEPWGHHQPLLTHVSPPGLPPTLLMAQDPISVPRGCQSLPQGCPNPNIQSCALMYWGTISEKLLVNSSQTVLLDKLGEREA